MGPNAAVGGKAPLCFQSAPGCLGEGLLGWGGFLLAGTMTELPDKRTITFQRIIMKENLILI